MIVAGIIKDSICDGINFRDVAFISGCPWNCPMCHNKEAQSCDYGKFYFVDSLAEILGNSKNDITLSGGDPLTYQLTETLELLKILKYKYNKNIWVYTGYTIEEILSSSNKELYDVLKYIDVLVDGKFDMEIRKLNPNPRFRGSENQRIIDVKKSLSINKIILFED